MSYTRAQELNVCLFYVCAFYLASNKLTGIMPVFTVQFEHVILYSVYRVCKNVSPPLKIYGIFSAVVFWHFIGPIPWGHSSPLCHALSMLWTSMRRQHATVVTPGEWQCKTGGMRRLAVANGPNIFQMLLVMKFYRFMNASDGAEPPMSTGGG